MTTTDNPKEAEYGECDGLDSVSWQLEPFVRIEAVYDVQPANANEAAMRHRRDAHTRKAQILVRGLSRLAAQRQWDLTEDPTVMNIL